MVMMRSLSSLVLALAIALAGAFVADRDAVASPTADYSGEWTFQVEVAPDRLTLGRIKLHRENGPYTGSLTTNQGNEVLFVREFTVRNGSVAMTVVSRDGLVTFEGRLAPDHRSFRGTVTYHNGARYPLAAVKL